MSVMPPQCQSAANPGSCLNRYEWQDWNENAKLDEGEVTFDAKAVEGIPEGLGHMAASTSRIVVRGVVLSESQLQQLDVLRTKKGLEFLEVATHVERARSRMVILGQGRQGHLFFEFSRFNDGEGFVDEALRQTSNPRRWRRLRMPRTLKLEFSDQALFHDHRIKLRALMGMKHESGSWSVNAGVFNTAIVNKAAILLIQREGRGSFETLGPSESTSYGALTIAVDAVENTPMLPLVLFR